MNSHFHENKYVGGILGPNGSPPLEWLFTMLLAATSPALVIDKVQLK